MTCEVVKSDKLERIFLGARDNECGETPNNPELTGPCCEPTIISAITSNGPNAPPIIYIC